MQLVGSMTMSARDTAIKKFKEDPDCKIFLMSLKAGGVALNLTVASHVSFVGLVASIADAEIPHSFFSHYYYNVNPTSNAPSFLFMSNDFYVKVFLMDPWWNPAVERQAQDRIHRIGQYKPIR